MIVTYVRYTQEPDNNAKCYHCYYFRIKINLPLSNILVLYDVSFRKIKTAFPPSAGFLIHLINETFCDVH